MIIHEKTVYVCGAKQFDSREKAIDHEFDVIGDFLRQSLFNQVVMHSRDQIRVVEFLIAYRHALIGLLENNE